MDNEKMAFVVKIVTDAQWVELFDWLDNSPIVIDYEVLEERREQ